MATCPQCSTFYANATSCTRDGALLIEDEKARARGLTPVAAERFEILSLLGEGGMGVVYLALHRDLRRKVALKVLRKEGQGSQALERFKREARASSMIGHRNVVSILDFGELPDGSMFYVMEHLEGKSLADAIDNEGPFSLERAMIVAVQIARGLAAAHEKGVIHRDLKPDNIFLLTNQEFPNFVKILDFGIAKLADVNRITKTGMVLGTPDYMSPEQAMGKQADLRADIYALGILLYEMLIGQRPFMGETFMQVLSQHLYAPPPLVRENRTDIAIPEGYDEIIQKALAKKPENRYQSMEEILQALYALPNAMEILPESILPNARRSQATPAVRSSTVPPVSNPPSPSSVPAASRPAARPSVPPVSAPSPAPPRTASPAPTSQPASSPQGYPSSTRPPVASQNNPPSARPAGNNAPNPQGTPWVSGGYRSSAPAKAPAFSNNAPQRTSRPPLPVGAAASVAAPTVAPPPPAPPPLDLSTQPEEDQPTGAWLEDDLPVMPLETHMIPVDLGSMDSTNPGLLKPAPPAKPDAPVIITTGKNSDAGRVLTPAKGGASRLAGRAGSPPPALADDDMVDQATSIAQYSPQMERPNLALAGALPAEYEESAETSLSAARPGAPPPTELRPLPNLPNRGGAATLLDGALNANNLPPLDLGPEATLDVGPDPEPVSRDASTRIVDPTHPMSPALGPRPAALKTAPEADGKATLDDFSRDQVPQIKDLKAGKAADVAKETRPKTNPEAMGAILASALPAANSGAVPKIGGGVGWLWPVLGIALLSGGAAVYYFFFLH